jgi:hypothetical protein
VERGGLNLYLERHISKNELPRHREPKAKQSGTARRVWIASSLRLLAMTGTLNVPEEVPQRLISPMGRGDEAAPPCADCLENAREISQAWRMARFAVVRTSTLANGL